MATNPVVEERHVIHHDDDTSSSAATMAVLLVAAALIVGFLLYAMRVFPFSAVGPARETQAEIDVDLPEVNTPAPDVNIDNNANY